MFFRNKTPVRIKKKTCTTPDNILNCFSVIKRSESENSEERSIKRIIIYVCWGCYSFNNWPSLLTHITKIII